MNNSVKKNSVEPQFRQLPAQRKRVLGVPMAPVAILAAAILLLGIIWGSFLAFSSGNNSTPTPTPTDSGSSLSLVPKTGEDIVVKHGATGKSFAQDQKDALAAVTALLKESGVSPTKADAQTRLQTLDKDDYSVVSKKTQAMVRFPGGSPASFKSQVYQSLITLYEMTMSLKKDIKPQSPQAYQAVLVDSQLGMAFVPLSIYTDTNTTFAFEMVYVDGSWKLTPYALLQQIKLSASLSQQNAASPTN